MRAPWIVLASMVLLSACVSSPPGRVYSHRDAQRPWTVRDGTVVQVSEAVIEGRETAIGTVGGGFIGHAVASGSGHGYGSSVSGAVGAVAGAVLGRKVEKEATRQKAWEILVEVGDTKEVIAIVQPADQTFGAGERVRVYTHGGAARVAKL
jgi:outer membrane lipoprotein SlyB